MAVVGKVGSGKSSLISALLGEMELVEGHVNVRVSTVSLCQRSSFHINLLWSSHRVFKFISYDISYPVFSYVPRVDCISCFPFVRNCVFGNYVYFLLNFQFILICIAVEYYQA